MYLIYVDNNETAKDILQTHTIGIALLDCTISENENKELVDSLILSSINPEIFMVLMSHDLDKIAIFSSTIRESICDILKVPFDTPRLNVKIGNYRRIFFSVQRVSAIMESTFPPKVIEAYRNFGRVRPKRYDNAVIIFTDFVNFSKFSSRLEPLELLALLEKYFLKFDDICKRFHIEKIKTIGDAYMAIAGVMEELPNPEIRTCLAAIEMQKYVQSEFNLLKAQGIEGWEIRIGINSGSLVGGIAGRDKMFYDVWGDSVNIAARAEQSSFPGKILITEQIKSKVSSFFHTEFYDFVEIKRRGGKIAMHFLQSLKDEFRQDAWESYPNKKLLNQCQLFSIDFDRMHADIVHFLKCYLSKKLCYHTINRTLKIEKTIEKYAYLLAMDEHSVLLLKTAILYHDIGYVVQYQNNEQYAIMLAKNRLPAFGYSEEDIQKIQSLIWITSYKASPKNEFEQLIRDANSDYLGRTDYFVIAENLRKELATYDREMTDLEWIDHQLYFLENMHQYFTGLVRDLREEGKLLRIKELRKKKENLLNLNN